MVFGYSWLVEIDELSDNRRKVNRIANQAKRTRLCFGNVQCGIQRAQKSIEALDCVTDGVTPLFAGLTG
jgi:hypothetical protein